MMLIYDDDVDDDHDDDDVDDNLVLYPVQFIYVGINNIHFKICIT